MVYTSGSLSLAMLETLATLLSPAQQDFGRMETGTLELLDTGLQLFRNA